MNRIGLIIVVISMAWACDSGNGSVTNVPQDIPVEDEGSVLDSVSCTPACDGRECGDDGCGGTCGSCPVVAPVCDKGACVLECTPDCEGLECGDDGCGGDCGSCDDGLACTIESCSAGVCGSLIQAYFCLLDGTCVSSGTVDPLDPCGICLPGAAQDAWSTAEDGTPCGGKRICFAGGCCDPVAGCDGIECGDDGCGGSCGDCPEEQSCVEGACVLDCLPSCDGKPCGDDGCGGSCGDCAAGYACEEDEGAGTAACVAECAELCLGLECGPAGDDDECDCGTCDDQDVCTDDACGGDGICAFTDNEAPCDDGNPCTGDDACDEGTCVGGFLPLEQLIELECICGVDADCLPIENDDVCDGTLVCADPGGASPAVCDVDPSTILDCDDGKPCTDDTCDPVLGCVYEADDDNACADADPCNGIETCISGVCFPGQPLACDDFNPCTDDTCAALQGCVYTPDDGNVCADGDGCDGVESCSGGQCTPGVPMDCDDGDKCTADTCAPETGCSHVPAAGVCDDGLDCTADACADDECSHTLQPFYCILDDLCVPSGAEDPGNSCQKCAPTLSMDEWTYLGDGIPCGLGMVCYQGACCDHATSCALNDCGADGCGGVCGTCPADWSCQDGLCVAGPCDPDCEGKVCGPDGCGDVCGTCEGNEFCTLAGSCVCIPDCTDKQCGDNGCGGTCGTCPENWSCDAGICTQGPCDPDCDGKACGSDGCGDVCGTCAGNQFCTIAGACVCIPDCTDKQCGDNGCGGSCGSCPVDWTCDSGLCLEDPCDPDCEGKACGPDGCGDICGTCPGNHFCTLAGACFCLPECSGKQCGDNGCGGACGTCPAGWSCEAGLCEEGPCEPDCDGKTCGPDGCGDSCGSCPVNHFCSLDGTCFCLPSCSGKQCGDNGCGGNCGICLDGWSCADGLCSEDPCEPDCDGKECGSDGCGDVCGTCGPGFTCSGGTCTEINPGDSCQGNCTASADSCDCDELCFVLGSCCADVCDACPDLDGCTCGDAACDAGAGEDCATCPADCACTECGEECVDGECAFTACDGNACGDDGCGGDCGSCEVPSAPCVTGAFCVEGTCQVQVQSFYCLVEGVCVPSGTENPENSCQKCLPNVAQIGWSSIEDGTDCGDGNACHQGVCCVYDCAGKECGPDGCGGTCGECTGEVTCSINGLCNGCEDGNAVDWDGCTGGEISEFQVNGYWTGNQQNSRLAVLENDGFAVTWEYAAGGTAATDVHFRMFDPEGTPMGIESVVHSSVQGQQQTPRILATPGGGCIVFWQQYPVGETQFDIFAQRYLPSGEKDGDPFVASPDSSAHDRYAEAVLLEGGELMVIWTIDYHVYGRRMLLDGTPLGIQIDIAYASSNSISLTALPGGGFLVTYLAKVGGSQGKYKVHGRWFDEYGIAQGQGVLIEDQGDTLHQTAPRAMLTSNDELVVAWSAYYNGDGSGYGSFARMLTASGDPIGDLFPVNTTTQSDQNGPRPLALGDGRFAIVWNGNGPGDNGGAFLQRFEPDTAKLGIETRVNTYTEDAQWSQDVDSFSDGSFMVLWQSANQDGSSNGIYAQRFSSEGHKLYR